MSNRTSWAGRLFLENKGTKLLSIALAVLVWYAIRDVIGVTRIIRGIPIVVRLEDPRMTVLSQSDNSADVTFQGSQEDLDQLEEAHVKAQLRIVVYARGESALRQEIVTLLPRNVEGVKSARAVRINSPSTVRVEFDSIAERQVAVKPLHKGVPAVGRVASVACSPGYVRVRGPAKRLMALKDENLVVYSESVDLSDASRSFKRAVKVFLPVDTWVAEIEPEEVEVTVTLEREPATRRLAAVPVLAVVPVGSAMQVDVAPAQVSVTLTGGSEELEAVKESDVMAFVNCVGLRPAVSYEGRPVEVLLLQTGRGLSWTVEPSTARVACAEMPK